VLAKNVPGYQTSICKIVAWVLFQYHPHLHVAGWLIAYGEYEYVTNIHREYTATLKCGYRRYIHELTLIEVTNDELTTILQHQDIGIWYQQNRHPIKKRPWWTIFMR
jgi:hypothetical protein